VRRQPPLKNERYEYCAEVPHYLFSTSPIPPLLHTCQESRTALKNAGYALAFILRNAKNTERQIWFNFKLDILYLGQPDKDSFYPVSVDNCLDCDLVEKVAVQTTLSNPNFLNTWIRSAFSLRPSNHLFPKLRELLVVEEHCGETGSTSLDCKRDKEGDLWGYVECDVSEALWKCIPDGEALFQRYSDRIWEYRESTGTYGRDFFRQIARTFELKIESHQRAMFRYVRCDKGVIRIIPEAKPLYAPKVRVVTVTTRSAAARLLEKRARYWEVMPSPLLQPHDSSLTIYCNRSYKK